jgi:arylformamidase
MIQHQQVVNSRPKLDEAAIQRRLGEFMVDDTRSAVRSLDPRARWSELSQTERDAAYDNNTAVKNSAALIAERNEASGRLRGTLKSHLDLPYLERAKTKIDLYPAAKHDAPCLVFLHGGYWQRNSRELFAMLVEGVAAHGWSVVIPGYSLAPEVSLTDIVAEISRALDWLAEHGASYGTSGPVVLSGWSAGAHLVAWRWTIRAYLQDWRFPVSTTSRRSAIPA